MPCTRCGQPTPDGANYCPWCGTTLGSDEPARRSVAALARTAEGATILATPPPASPPRPDTSDGNTAFSLEETGTFVLPAAGGAPAAPFDPDATGYGSAPLPQVAGWSEDVTRLSGTRPASTPIRPPSAASVRRTPVPNVSRPRGAEPVDAAGGPFTVGQQFGRYTIIRLLGMGGMGAVYQAWDEELEIPVALKVIRPEAIADEATALDLQRRFKRELLLARQVTHKNVVRIHDLGEMEGIKYITMTYVHGVDLATMLRNAGKLPVAQALRIVRGIVSGLVAAHEAGVVHRDLKPANIMVEEDTDEPVIMDFGIARTTGVVDDVALTGHGAGAGLRHSSLTQATLAGSIVGTIGYMAPEQATGQDVDQRADIYALGLIFSDILLGPGRLDHTGGAMGELQHRLEHTLPGPRSADETVPEAVDAIIARCLQRDRADRYQTTGALAAALNGIDENGIPIPVLRTVTGRVMAGVAAVTLSLMAATYWFTRPPPPPVQHAPMSVLVADFQNRTNDPLFTGTLESPLATGLEGASFITSYNRQTARRLVNQIRAGAMLDADGARLVSAREGIKVVVAGSIEAAGSGYTVKVDAIDPAVNKVLATTTASAASKEKVLGAIGAAAAELRGGLGDTAPQSARVAAMETVTVGSLEALQAYERGQALLGANKLQEALAAYQQAVKIDPGLGRAYAGMGVIYFDLKDEAKGRAAYEEALKRVDRMTDREKLRTLGTYYLLVARNYEKAIENYETLLSQYPADSAAHGNLAIASMYTGNLKRAVAEAREVLNIYPKNTRQRRNYAMYLMWAGEFDTAIAEGNKVIAETPSYALGYLPIALSQAAKGDVTGASGTYERMQRSGSADGARLGRLGRVDLAMLEGRYRDALKLVADAVAADATAGNSGALAADYLASAETAFALGQKARALEGARKAVELSAHESVLFPAALLFIDLDRQDEADKIAVRLENMLQTQTTAYSRLVDGQSAVKRGRYAQAIEMFRDGLKRRDTWFGRYLLGKAYAETDHFAEAMAELEIAVNRRGEVTDVFINDTPTLRYLPAVYYWLARSQQAMGVPNAPATFQQYLDLRAKADPADPLAVDARARIAQK